MEHWVFEPEVLKVYAKHHETGEVIPQAIVDKIVKSGRYGQGFATTEYVASSLLDMDYHVLKEVPVDLNIEKFELDAMYGRGLLKQIAPRYWGTYFGHTMEGGYTAGTTATFGRKCWIVMLSRRLKKRGTSSVPKWPPNFVHTFCLRAVLMKVWICTKIFEVRNRTRSLY